MTNETMGYMGNEPGAVFGDESVSGSATGDGGGKKALPNRRKNGSRSSRGR